MKDKSFLFYITVYSILKLPSTFFHELSHALVAVAFGCQIKGFSLIPKREESGFISFGEVIVGARYPGVFFPVGLAPLIWLIVSFLIFYNDILFFDNKYITFAIILYLAGGGFPSFQDFYLAYKGLMSFSGIIILLSMIAIGFLYAKYVF